MQSSRVWMENMNIQFFGLVLLLLLFLAIAGCGQKGPLFLPGNTNEVSMSIPAQQADPEDDDEDDEEEDESKNQ